jgi:hypothetical protein
MFTLDPYGDDTMNTSSAFYECWECPENPFCIKVQDPGIS